MLTFAEEITLLALDDKTGTLLHLPERSLDFALSGALMLELAFKSRLDTDDAFVEIISREPTGNAMLDQAMRLIPDTPNLTIQSALARIAKKGDHWESKTLESLVQKGVLMRKEDKFLWVMRERTYPVIDDKKVKEVHDRIRAVVMDLSAIPSPRDVVIIALMNACELTSAVFSADEAEKYRDRIDNISKMDAIARAVAHSISEIQNAILEVIAYSGI